MVRVSFDLRFACLTSSFQLLAENQNHMQVEAIYFTEQQDYKFTSVNILLNMGGIEIEKVGMILNLTQLSFFACIHVAISQSSSSSI